MADNKMVPFHLTNLVQKGRKRSPSLLSMEKLLPSFQIFLARGVYSFTTVVKKKHFLNPSPGNISNPTMLILELNDC